MSIARPRIAAMRNLLAYAGLFAFGAAVSAYVQWQPAFKDADSFYHAKMAELMLAQGAVRDFPWLPFTTLAANFADHHFLYHLLLLPFVRIWGAFLGLKIATAVFSSLAVASFYGLLRAHAVRWPWFFALCLGGWSGFVFRSGLAKASAVSVAFALLGLLAAKRGNSRALFTLSFFYVWLHGSWPMMALVAAAYAAGACFSGDRRRAKTTLASTIGGLAAGLVINPYFPANLAFYWEQTVQIALIGHGTVVRVGGEWSSPSIGMIMNGAGIVFILLAIAAASWPRRPRPISADGRADVIASGLLAAATFLMMLRSYRHVEFFMPFALLFAAVLLSAARPEQPRRRSGCLMMATGLAAFIFLFLLVREVRAVRASFDRGYPWSAYEQAAAWLAANVEPGEIIFHGDWEDFPILFYRADRFRYIVGLDPTFLYRRNPEKYRLWAAIAAGKFESDTAAVIEKEFGARIIFIRKGRQAMRSLIERDGHFAAAYEDVQVWIYQMAE